MVLSPFYGRSNRSGQRKNLAVSHNSERFQASVSSLAVNQNHLGTKLPERLDEDLCRWCFSSLTCIRIPGCWLKTRQLGIPRFSDQYFWVGPETCPYNQLPGEAMRMLHLESPPREPVVWEPPLWRDGSAKTSDSPPTSKCTKLSLAGKPGTLAKVKNGNSTNRKWAALEDSAFFSTFLVLVSALLFILINFTPEPCHTSSFWVIVCGRPSLRLK